MDNAPSHHRAAALVVSTVIVLGLARSCDRPLPAQPPAVVTAPPLDAGPPRVDPNVASLPELEALPGIGPTLARRILAARREGPRFARPEDLLRVRGLRRRTLDRLRPHLTFENHH